ncbi:MAG: Asp23/Gls24 family envelope stress response protein, partial [Clostridia bacterium]|nr:Asp23/Gls24 family envelope stress response protein [Clostridia bacterium]
EGKHVIPVPTFEIKQDFSGYFIHPLKRFLKNRNEESNIGAADKSIVRPTFSYLGDFTISDNVINSIAIHEANKIDGLHKVISTNLRKTVHGIHIDMTLALKYGYNIAVVSKQVQHAVRKNVEEYTSINARRINIVVKNLVK